MIHEKEVRKRERTNRTIGDVFDENDLLVVETEKGIIEILDDSYEGVCMSSLETFDDILHFFLLCSQLFISFPQAGFL